MNLDEEKLEALRNWGERLRQADGEESAAVGRAILMLVEEIDRLHIELWHARIQRRDAGPAPTERAEEPVASSLQSRLRQTLRRERGATPVDEAPEPTTDAGSPQAWIAALRRQK